MMNEALDNSIDWKALNSKNFKISNELKVSSISLFGDSKWQIANIQDQRVKYSPSLYFIDWEQYQLPKKIIFELKVFSYLMLKVPWIFTVQQKAAAHGLKPLYYLNCIKHFTKFIQHIYQSGSINIKSAPINNLYLNPIHSLFDVTVSDLKSASHTWESHSLARLLVRKCLICISNPAILPYITFDNTILKTLSWNTHDVKKIDFKISKKIQPGTSDLYRDKPLPDDLLKFLINTASSDLHHFMDSLNLNYGNAFDSFNSNYNSDLFRLSLEMFEFLHKTPLKQKKTGHERSRGFLKQFGISLTTFHELLERFEMSCKYLILQFTGMRFSEVVSLKCGCLLKVGTDEFVIKGYVSKNRSIKLLNDNDSWVATPLLICAIKSLEFLAEQSGHKVLFAAQRLDSNFKDLHVSDSALNNSLSKYLYDIDNDKKYSTFQPAKYKRYKSVKVEFRLTTHRIRHTLALQMCRAGVGLPYISYQLKHIYSAYRRFDSISNVTLGYGNIGSDIFFNATGIKEAKREIVQIIYHPDSKVAGPNAQEFKNGRNAFFTGMMASGWTKEEILEMLLDRGASFADVGLGYCSGRNEFENESGEKVLPPCLGQLKCNPNQCKNAIITEDKIPIWKTIYQENNKRLQDPQFFFANEEQASMIAEAKSVLQTLGVNENEI